MSALDEEYLRLGLTRPGAAVRQLHVIPRYARELLPSIGVEWKGETLHGYRTADVLEAHDKMWPDCPWAARGQCWIAQSRAAGT